MSEKENTPIQPGDFSNDRFEKILAEGQEVLRNSKLALVGLRLPPAGIGSTGLQEPKKKSSSKYQKFWKKGLEGLHPSQMRKIEKWVVKADLTITERDCYYLRVGYSKTFAEIASRMGWTHHSTAQEHFVRARVKIESKNSTITSKYPQK